MVGWVRGERTGAATPVGGVQDAALPSKAVAYVGHLLTLFSMPVLRTAGPHADRPPGVRARFTDFEAASRLTTART